MKEILFDRYKILDKLGSGGFGETFLAEDMQASPPIPKVIKSLKPFQDEISAEIREQLFKCFVTQ